MDDDAARDPELVPDGEGVFDREWLRGSKASLISGRKAIEGAVDMKMTIAAAFGQSIFHASKSLGRFLVFERLLRRGLASRGED